MFLNVKRTRKKLSKDEDCVEFTLIWVWLAVSAYVQSVYKLNFDTFKVVESKQ